MPKVSETLNIELIDADYHVLRTYAHKIGETLEEYISEVLRDHAIKLLLNEDIE